MQHFRKNFFVRLCSEFIVNLWENWNLGCFTNCFQDSGSSARLHSLCALFQCVLRRPELCYDFECPKILKFWEGSVHTSILTICVCFSNCCFGILMTRSFSFKQLFDELIRAVSVWIPACSKEASGNTLHHHTRQICSFWICAVVPQHADNAPTKLSWAVLAIQLDAKKVINVLQNTLNLGILL